MFLVLLAQLLKVNDKRCWLLCWLASESDLAVFLYYIQGRRCFEVVLVPSKLKYEGAFAPNTFV